MRRIRSLIVMAACAAGFFSLSSADSAGQDFLGATQEPFEAPPVHQPNAGMLRYPDVSATHIVFVYANDLWVAPREGGVARPLASPPGQERFPKFSPDGQRIAFSGNYDGNPDLYTIPLQGGIPQRVTHHPASESLCDWTPQGKLLFYSNGLAPMRRQTQLLFVSAAGGLPQHCPVPYGANGAVSPDGRWLAYTPHSRDHRTWKRYRGGMATDIWLMDLNTKKAKKVTDWEGSDTLPMWHGETLYYLSDAGPENRLNIWSYNLKSGQRKQITKLDFYDVKWPSMGPGAAGQGEIIFQYGPSLACVDLKTLKQRVITIHIPGAQASIRPRNVDVAKYITKWNLSPTARRVVVEARGDIWTLPASKGAPRNLTRTSGVAERDPAWSPDGRWIAYFSDVSGEYELFITQSDGTGRTQKLTSGSRTFYYSPSWSPDSKQIAFFDKAGSIFVHSLVSHKTKKIDADPFAQRHRVSWSRNSKWLAYIKNGRNRTTSIWLHELSKGKSHQVTAGMFSDSWPTFGRGGKYLFFASNRRFGSPIYEDIGSSFVYGYTDILLAAPLKEGNGTPWQPVNDEESFPGRKTVVKPRSTSKNYIDVAGFESRAFALPRVAPGSFSSLDSVSSTTLVYVRGTPRGISSTNNGAKLYSLNSRSESTIVSGASSIVTGARTSRLLIRKSSTLYMANAAASQTLARVPTSGMTAAIRPRQEWRQLFTDAWRIQRDYFYDPNMHGVDWPAMRNRYGRMIEDCANREDVSFVIGEMIAELNVGHTYVRSQGDVQSVPKVSVGMLGCDYELHQGAYRIAKIYQGAPWDYDARGPLSQPGVKVKAGDYLLAVNGRKLDTSKDPWAAFIGLAGKVTRLTLSAKPKRDASARDLLVVPLSSESTLRYRAWIEKNRAYVDKKSQGQVGYIFVPDTGSKGQSDLFRQFYGQRHKKALIIDERWNSGGQIPTRFIELLNRPVTNYWARRHGWDWTWPRDAHQGPKCMLINGMAGSGGDAFPWYFRQAGLGKLIGMRTWGGLVGMTGNPTLIDGGRISAPTFAFYEKDGTWGIEGHGVDPDIEVIDDPSKMQNGFDPQLAAGVTHMLAEIKRNPHVPPKRPAYPDRTKIGIREEDK